LSGPGGGGALAAREAALHALFRVNHQGAWSNILIEQELSRQRLQGPDRGFYVRLVRGCLERQGALDWALRQYVRRPLAGLDPWPRELLRLGAYQLLFTDVPPFAAVDTTVQLARQLSGAPSSRLANAVLRRLAAHRAELSWPDRFADPVGYLSTYESHPRWLVERWIGRFGEQATVDLCAANNTAPGTTIRVNTMRTSRARLMEQLAGAGYDVAAGEHAPEALHVAGGGDLRRAPGYSEGLFIVQDEASMLAARSLCPQPGERVIDACAAPGGKTTHLAALAGDMAEVLAFDINRSKLAQVRARAARLGLASISTTEGDARTLGEVAPRHADALLLDAPCSGLGVVRRRPEVRWRRQASDLPLMAARQLELLHGVAPAVRPGGRLTYAVCSFEPEETTGVVAGFLASPQRRAWEIACEPTTLLPHRHRTDGFFFVLLVRRQ
jgi:16S rRNA (cytosine967-C5)-methyltransferase